MPEPDLVSQLVERIVAGAHIPSRKQRADLRRELLTHFEDTGTSPEAVRDAMHRFGCEETIAQSFQRVYRLDYMLFYFIKIAASIVVSMSAALLIQVLVNLRLEVQADVLRLAPEFSRAAALSIGVVLGIVTAWEVGRQPFNRSRAMVAIGAYAIVCIAFQLAVTKSTFGLITATLLVVLGCICSKFELRPNRLPLILGAFAAALYVTHLMISVTLDPVRTLLASAVLVVVWISTVLILTRFDEVFFRMLE